MRKSLFTVLGTAAALGAALLTTTAASAAPHARAAPGPGDTTVTFSVTSGLLTMAVPGSAALGTGLPGTTISGKLGQVTVTDDRALLHAAWTASASSTDFTTPVTGTVLSTIPVADGGYDPGEVSTTGTITPIISVLADLSALPQTVVAGTAGTGNNTATWNPVISVDIPPDAVGGSYTSTLTQSVA